VVADARRSSSAGSFRGPRHPSRRSDPELAQPQDNQTLSLLPLQACLSGVLAVLSALTPLEGSRRSVCPLPQLRAFEPRLGGGALPVLRLTQHLEARQVVWPLTRR
jgi:diadenosine tetraphosphatase ApaH/serine/threonine PP2A family protein phosphatase